MSPGGEDRNTPRMYCTPKIHKEGTPLRPIVDYTGSIGYNLSRSLADVLGPLVGRTKHHVENSQDLAKDLKEVKLEDDEMMASHDVVSLFTNTPIPEAMDIIRKRLVSDKSLKKRTNLQVDDIMQLLEFVLTTTYFTFRGQVYQQKFGTAMGSPVSPIVANLFMEDLEQRAIDTAPPGCKPRLWKRYVDDTLEIIKRGKIEEWTEHLNGVDTSGSIKFTYEVEDGGSIAFLDTLIDRREDGSLKLRVYRKKTHTNQYLSFKSHHPLHQKLGVVRTLLDRCENLVTEERDKISEKETISSALQICGYPTWTMKNVEEKIADKREKNENRKKTKTHTDVDQDKNRGMVVIPYVSGVSEKLARIFKKRRVSTAIKPLTNHCPPQRQD